MTTGTVTSVQDRLYIIDLVTFTGSEGVSRHIGEVTGRNLVPATLEL